jgi:hypothetical protein
MKKRFKMKKKRSGKLFKKTADLTHKFNMGNRPMRGGIRL